MIKLKKLLAGVLGAAMMLSSMSLTAFAEDATPNTITGATATGSLTINKTDSTGAVLSGVEFTVYKLAGITVENGVASVTMNSNIPLKGDATLSADDLEAIANNADSSAAEWEALVAKVNFDSTALDNFKMESKTTGTDGKAVFSSLPLGIYAVAETDAPAHVIEKTANFIVSIPMTDSAGDSWVYDVVTSPKNSTALGGVTLEKVGKVGTTTESLNGATFVLQKKVNNAWVNATKTDGSAVGKLTTAGAGTVNVQNLPYGDYRFVETSVGNGYIMDGATTYNFKITTDNKVVYNNKTLDDSDAIEVTNYKPDLDKQVKADGTTTYQEAADYSIGDKVDYKITVYVPENITALTKFNVEDTPTNLNDDSTTIVIKCGDATLTKGTEYTVEDSTDGNGFTVTFNPTVMSSCAGKDITIEYKAELLSTAVTTTAGNPNTATLTYSNKIVPTTDDDNPNEGGTPSENTIKDDAVVYTFMLKVFKTNGENAPLADVEFDVYSYAGTATNPTETELTASGTKITSIKTDANGNASVSGLQNGKYYLVETKTNNGYNLLKNPVAVTLNVQYATTWTESNTYDNAGNLVKHVVTAKTETFGGAADTTSNGYASSTVINKKGFKLPTTGGMGSIIFIVGGIAIALAGLMIILASRKKTAAN